MPKIVVLMSNASPQVSALADSAADGCRTVRFTEVDIRLFPGGVGGGTRRALRDLADLLEYDGVVVCCDPSERAPVAVALAELAAKAPPGFSEKVSALALTSAAQVEYGEAWNQLERLLTQMGMLYVPPSLPKRVATAPEDASHVAALAHHIGHRIAHVVEWVTHARHHHH